mmetsp:Transcript_8804/g.12116  ORF Transcript_8804/g.12116 Transcript_8804/m.12116 type:complete len:135 (+) Transcript_8804:2-406(+)
MLPVGVHFALRQVAKLYFENEDVLATPICGEGLLLRLFKDREGSSSSPGSNNQEQGEGESVAAGNLTSNIAELAGEYQALLDLTLQSTYPPVNYVRREDGVLIPRSSMQAWVHAFVDNDFRSELVLEDQDGLQR